MITGCLWIERLLGGTMRRSRSGGAWKKRAASQPRLEPLEGRAVPSTAYTVVNLGSLGGRNAESMALNDKGVVVGSSDVQYRGTYAFRDAHGKMTSLGTLFRGGGSVAYSINNRGEVLGVSSNRSGSVSEVFLYTNGRMKPIKGKVPGPLDTHLMRPFAINDLDQVIGFASKAGNAVVASGGRFKDLGSLNGLGSVATGLNDKGTIVGYSNITPYHDYFNTGTVHPFVYQHGHMTDIGTLGGSDAAATAINNQGDVVGWSSTTGDKGQDAFFYHDGTMIDIGRLGGGGASATAVNDKGQVVGWSNVNGSLGNHQFLYSNGEMIDLNAFIPASAGFTLTSVVGINNRGQIAGFGTLPNRHTVALLLNSVK